MFTWILIAIVIGAGLYGVAETDPASSKLWVLKGFFGGAGSAIAVLVIVWILLSNPGLWNALSMGQR